MAKVRRRRRSNAPPGVLPVTVKAHSRSGEPKKKKKRRAKAASTAAPKRRRRAKAKGTAAPKRRRRAKAKSNPPKRRRRRRTKSAAPKRRRRRSTKSAAPKRRRRRSTKIAAPKRRRRRSTKSAALKNPRKGGRRRSRSNPATGAVRSVRSELKKLMQPQSWLPATLHGVAGVAIAHYGPSQLSRVTAPLGLNNFGYGGVVLSGLSTAIGAGLLQALAGMLPKKGLVGACCAKIGRNVFAGGAIATVIRLLHEVMPGSVVTRQLPRIGATGVAGMGALPGYGSYPGQYPSLAPLGSFTTPEELVAGESLARQIGAEGGLGEPVPVQDIRGMRDFMELTGRADGQSYGMRGWLEFDPTSGFVQEEAFAPAAEPF